MRAVRIRDGGVEVVELPPPSGEGVRVRIRSSGICGSDLHMLDGPFTPKGTIGHEMAGYTDDGTAVAIEPLQPCGACESCDAGDYNRCRLGPAMVMGTVLDGGMAEEVRVPARCLVPLPAGVRVEDACLVEPLAVAVHGFLQVRLRGDQRVAIVGGGSIGLAALAVAAAGGARVSMLARHDHQRAAAERLGASSEPGEAHDIVVDAAGTASSLERCVELAKPGGTLLLLASYWEGLELPGFALCMKELRIVPSMTYSRQAVGRDVDLAAAILAGNASLADVLITHRLPLEAAPEAFRTAADRRSGSIKVVLEP